MKKKAPVRRRQKKELESPHGELLVKNTGGRPTRPLPKLTYKEGTALLSSMNAEQLVEMMGKCGGDLEMFISSFDHRAGKQQAILARVLFILKKLENKAHWDTWCQHMECFRLAKMVLLESEALSEMENMPKPNNKTPLREWIAYGNFWQSDTGNDLKANKVNSKEAAAEAAKKAEKEAAEKMVAAMTEAAKNARSEADEQ